MKTARSYLAASVLFVVALLAVFSASAFAAGAAAPAPDASWTDLLRPVYDAFREGHYVAAGAFAVVLAVGLAKRYAGSGKFGRFMSSEAGATLAVLVASFAGAIGAAASASAWSWGMLRTAGLVAAAAAGGYTILKVLVVDPVLGSTWYQTKAPSWLKAIMSLLLFVFDKPSAVATATAAGNAAVAASPAQGADGVAGKPEQF